MNISTAGMRSSFLLLTLVGLSGGSVALISTSGCRSRLRDDRPYVEDLKESRIVCTGHVDVAEGVIALTPDQPGRVVEVRVPEGTTMKKGEAILRLDDRHALDKLAVANAELHAAEVGLDQARKLAKIHQADILLQKSAISVASSRLAGTRHHLTRQKNLLEKKLVAVEEVRIAEESVKEWEAVLESEKQKLQKLDVSNPKEELARAEAEAKVKQSHVATCQRAIEDCTLHAPTEGSIVRVLVGQGDIVPSQAKPVALYFCSSNPRIIRAEVPQEFAGRVFIGQAAIIQDDAGPQDSVRARVTRISDWLTQRRSVLQEPLQKNDIRTLECILTPETETGDMRIGKRVRVVLLLD